MKVRLETRSGMFVANHEIPPFQVPPEVIWWGSRYFGVASDTSDEIVTYREVMVWFIPDEEKESDRST